jgi:quinol-cytochrome oxidoreductase complex cytochrome b subunit
MQFLYNYISSKESFLNLHAKIYPTPRNLRIFWVFGSVLLALLFIQIGTGIFLAVHYIPDSGFAFILIEKIIRHLPEGASLRNLHANGASLIFICLYLHIFRGIYYSSYINKGAWMTGIVLFILMMATAFLGYVLPWGQMSYWGGTVISNIFTVIPNLGDFVVLMLRGNFVVAKETLPRFYVFHYILPFLAVLIVMAHLTYLHKTGSSTPMFGSKADKIPMTPYIIFKDLFIIFISLSILIFLITVEPYFLGHTDNSIEGNSMLTPEHIVPEWYFLPFYAILRGFTNKTLGVIAMLCAILCFALFCCIPDAYITNEGRTRAYKEITIAFVSNFIFLGWLGMQPAEEPYTFFSILSIFLYFVFFGQLLYFQTDMKAGFLKQQVPTNQMPLWPSHTNREIFNNFISITLPNVFKTILHSGHQSFETFNKFISIKLPNMLNTLFHSGSLYFKTFNNLLHTQLPKYIQGIRQSLDAFLQKFKKH